MAALRERLARLEDGGLALNARAKRLPASERKIAELAVARRTNFEVPARSS
jgi:hypothetical protein